MLNTPIKKVEISELQKLKASKIVAREIERQLEHGLVKTVDYIENKLVKGLIHELRK